MNSGIYFLGFFGLLLFILFFVVPLFYKRKIQTIYYSPDSNEMFVLSNPYSTTITKRGIYERHRIYLNKIDFSTGKLLFTFKIRSFSNKMTYGFAQIIGLNENHVFIVTSGNRLFIADIKEGKLLYNDKQIRKSNPILRELNAESLFYDDAIKSIVVFDNSGHAFKLIPENLKLESYREFKSKEKRKPVCRELDTYKLTFLDPNRNYGSIAFADSISNEKKYFHSIDKPGSKRKFLIYDFTKENRDINTLQHDFLHPFIIRSGMDKQELITENSFLVLHAETEPCFPDNMLISYVTENSRIVWTRKASELIHKPYFSDYALVFYEKKGTSFFIFFYEKNTQSNVMSVSKVNYETGFIESPPLAVRF